MEIIHWTVDNWFELLQSVGIIGGLLFTARSIQKETEARKIDTMLVLGDRHHSIWKELHDRPGLSRLMDERVGVATKSITHEERLFVTQLILHLDSAHRAMKAKMFVNIDGLRADIRSFFSLPIPKAVWDYAKIFQDRDFVAFIESALAD